MQFALFGCGYLWFSDQCVEGIERFSHAFFFSVQTSATIGAPLLDCRASSQLGSAFWRAGREHPADATLAR